MPVIIVWLLLATVIAVIGRVIDSDGLTAVGGAAILVLAAVAGVSA